MIKLIGTPRPVENYQESEPPDPESFEDQVKGRPPIVAIIVLIVFAIIFIIGFTGCTKYNQINELHTKGISNYDTTRVIEKDSIIYPFWQKITITNYEDSLEINTYFLVHWISRGKADSNIYLGKDTVK